MRYLSVGYLLLWLNIAAVGMGLTQLYLYLNWPSAIGVVINTLAVLYLYPVLKEQLDEPTN